jgi:hypothetical protein
VRTLDFRTIAQGEKRDGLFYIPIINNQNKNLPLINHVKRAVDIETLHRRFGHLNKRNLDNLIKNTSSNNTYSKKKNKDKNQDHCCEVCLKAFFRNKVYRASTNKMVYEYLDKISSDLCGPFKTPTYNRYRYFITFLDKGTRFLEVELLRTKDEVYNAFVKFKARSENNKDNKRIRIFQSDNGGEYISKIFEDFLLREGIIHQRSPADTKEPNGFPERINQTLLIRVRAMLIDSRAPKYLWGEALLAATDIYNKTPHSSLKYKTPFEMKYKIKPNIDNIRIWGSKAYYKIKGPNRNNKLAEQAAEGILIGFGQDSHIYKVFDTNKQRAF